MVEASRPISGQITRWRTSIRGILGFDFGPDLGDLELNLRKFDINPGALGVDLGSNGGDDVLPGLAAAS